jgi:RNA polymerase sigma-70 factor (ECF subfamily)
MTQPSIDALLARARANDRTALSAVLQAYEPRLLRMIELRLDRSLRRRIEPDDVLQETFLEAVRRFDEWNADPRCPFHVWLRLTCAKSLTTAQRVHLGAQKRDLGREQALVDRPSVSAANVAECFVASQTSPSQAATREEAHELLLRALEELDDMDREILVLRNFEDLSNEDAAAELGIDPGTASKRFSRALLRLRPALRALEEE